MSVYSAEVSKLISEGSKFYASKQYDLSTEKYAEACEAFSKGQDSNDADLLLLYGKSLFQMAVTKSEVFGGSAEQDANDDEGETENENSEKSQLFQFSEDAPLAEQEEDDEDEGASNEEDGSEEKDEDSEDDNEAQENQDGEQEESDFEVAWEILELARSLFEKSLEDLETSGKETSQHPLLESEDEPTTNPAILLKQKLSDTYDLLGEVSLEAENFQQSAVDLESALNLRVELYPSHSTLVSESHYKLSLALEFCVDDPESRAKAIEQMELAIQSVEERGEITRNLDSDLVQDLNLRLQELKKDPTEELKQEQLKIIKGILGDPDSTADAKAEGSVSQAALNSTANSVPINDLSSMVKKRKVPTNKIVSSKKSKS